MKKYALNDITVMQYIFMIHGAQVGTGILSLPRQVAETSGTDGWISIILAWLLTCLAGLLIILVLKNYPDKTLPDLLNHLFGAWVGKLLLLPIIAYYAFYGWMIMVNSMLYIKSWFLVNTPQFLVMILFAIPSYLVVRNGLRVQARYVELVFYLTVWMPFFLLLPLHRGTWLFLLPVIKEGWGPILSGVPVTGFAFGGVEILFFIYPFLRQKQYAVRGFLIANTMTMLLYLFVTLACFVFYTPDGIASINQPLLSLLKNIEFRFLERFDTAFLSIYLFVVSKAWIPYIYCASFSTSHLVNKQDHSRHALLFLLLFIVSVYVVEPTWNKSDVWSALINKSILGMFFVVPLGLYLVERGTVLLRGRHST